MYLDCCDLICLAMQHIEPMVNADTVIRVFKIMCNFLLVPIALNELGRMSSALQASLNENVIELLTPL